MSHGFVGPFLHTYGLSMRVKFIVNPAAGRGRVGRNLASLEADWKNRLGSFDAAVTSGAADILSKTREALRAGYDRIVAVGGDGTVNGVANGFFEEGKALNPEAALAVSRWGTGSDYFRTVSGTGGSDWRDWVTGDNVRPVDVGRMEWKAGGRLFLNVSTIGMGAEVVRRREGLPKAVPAALAYLLPTVTTLFGFHPKPARVIHDGGEFSEGFLTLFLAKGIYAGGGMKLGGRVSLSDGKLDVTIVRDMPLWRTLPRLPKLYTGKFEGDSLFVQVKTSRLEVRSESAVPFEADGEFLGAGDIRVTVLPAALNVCFPLQR